MSVVSNRKHSWEDNTRMDLREMGGGGELWTGLIWHRIGTNGGIF
jgi:hypothetical protein